METTVKKKRTITVPIVIFLAYAVMGVLDLSLIWKAIALAVERMDIMSIVDQILPLVQIALMALIAVLLCVGKTVTERPGMRKILEICYWILFVISLKTFVSAVLSMSQERNDFSRILAIFPPFFESTKMMLLFTAARGFHRNKQEATMGATTAFVCGMLVAIVGLPLNALPNGLWEVLLLYALWKASVDYMCYTNAKKITSFARTWVIIGAVVLLVAGIFALSSGSGGDVRPRVGESASEYIKRADPDLYNSMLNRYNSLF